MIRKVDVPKERPTPDSSQTKQAAPEPPKDSKQTPPEPPNGSMQTPPALPPTLIDMTDQVEGRGLAIIGGVRMPKRR
jgi:hypothetical protein